MNIILKLMLLLSIILYSAGCASTRFGRDLSPEDTRALTAGLKGKDKETLIRTLGDPDFITSEKGSEYWGYHNRDGWHLSLYYGSAGKVEASDLVLKLKDSRSTDAFVIGKGSSTGFITSPLSMRD